MTVEEVVESAGAEGEASHAAWRRQAERLKTMIRNAREEWARVMPN